MLLKIQLTENMLVKVDEMIIAAGMAFTFRKVTTGVQYNRSPRWRFGLSVKKLHSQSTAVSCRKI